MLLTKSIFSTQYNICFKLNICYHHRKNTFFQHANKYIDHKKLFSRVVEKKLTMSNFLYRGAIFLIITLINILIFIHYIFFTKTRYINVIIIQINLILVVQIIKKH